MDFLATSKDNIKSYVQNKVDIISMLGDLEDSAAQVSAIYPDSFCDILESLRYRSGLDYTKINKILNCCYWKKALEDSGIFNILPSQEVDNLNDKFDHTQVDNVPEFTLEAASALIDSLAANSYAIRCGAIKDVAKKLNKASYVDTKKSNVEHNIFKISKKSRFQHFYPTYDKYNNDYNRSCDFSFFSDLENMCRIISNKLPLPSDERLGEKIKTDTTYNTCGYDVDWPYKVVTPYFKMTCYKKGTVLLEFLNDDVLTELNRLIADNKSMPNLF